ncbi:MAG: DUF3800 domain-containing protein, partial [Bacteroidota bacterium]
VAAIKYKYGLKDSEMHVGWILRPYVEQTKIPNFNTLNYAQRRYEVERFRKTEVLRLQKSSNKLAYNQTKKNYRQTESYIHLTYPERRKFVEEVAVTVGNWGYARVFAECVDKLHFSPTRTKQTVDEQAFEQVISRFEHFLRQINLGQPTKSYGLLIHDNNQTVAKKHTDLMKNFHQQGTLWTQIDNIIETPLFVDSSLTSMVQVADLCAYSLRRYLENQETRLFDHIFKRADRKGSVVVGVRHFTNSSCSCLICVAHRPSSSATGVANFA